MGTISTHRHVMTADHSKYDNSMTKSSKKTREMSNSSRSLVSSIALIDGPLGGVASRASNLNQIISRGNIALGGFALAVSGAGFGMIKMLKVVSEVETEMAKTEAILRATGGASGLLGDELDGLARSVARATLASTTEIRKAINSLLTFKSVGSDIFKDVISLSQDMAAVWGGTAATNARKLGKSLDDPIKQLSRLETTVGAFNPKARKAILEMAEMGNVAGAQARIIKELQDRIGGSGSAEASGLSGALDTASQSWGELFEKIDKSLGISGYATDTLNNMASALDRLNSAITEDTAEQEIATAYYARNQLLLDVSRNQRELNVLTNQARMGNATDEDVSNQKFLLSGLKDRVTVLNNEIKYLNAKKDIEDGLSREAKNAALEKEAASKKAIQDERTLAELDKLIFEGQQNKYKIFAENEKERVKAVKKAEDERKRELEEVTNKIVSIRNNGLEPLAREIQLHKDNVVELDKYRKLVGETALLRSAAANEDSRTVSSRQKILKPELEESFLAKNGKGADFSEEFNYESIAREEEQHALRMEKINQFRMADVDNLLAANDLKEDEAERHSKSMIQLAEMESNAKKQALNDFFSAGAVLMSSKSRKLFEIGKVAAIAQATVSTALGITRALELGPIIGPPLAAMQAAAGIVQIQAINSTQFGGGGTVTTPDTSATEDAQPVFQAPTDTRSAVNFIFNGDVSAHDAETIAEMLKEHINSTDFVMIEPTSRNGQELAA